MLDDIRDGHIIAPHRFAKRLDIPMGQLARMVQADATVLTTAPASLAGRAAAVLWTLGSMEQGAYT